MEKRNYTKCADAELKLETFCGESLRNGSFLLPGERELAAKLGVSRLTLRKAMETMQRNGRIRREGRRTEILPCRALRECGRIVFFAPGMHASFFQPAFERLWLTLKPRLESHGATPELYLDHDGRDFSSFRRAADSADIILLTLPAGTDKEKKVGYLRRLQTRKTVLALSDPCLEEFENIAALDNHAVGEEAARALLAAGCRRAAIVDVAFGISMFDKRCEGFRRVFLSQAGNEVGVYPRRAPENGARELLRICRKGFDSAFVVTDEHIGERMSLVLREGAIPERFKLISFNGSGEGIRCTPPVTCLNHGTSEVVEAILDFLKRKASSGEKTAMRKLVRPQLYLNKTIGEINLPLP